MDTLYNFEGHRRGQTEHGRNRGGTQRSAKCGREFGRGQGRDCQILPTGHGQGQPKTHIHGAGNGEGHRGPHHGRKVARGSQKPRGFGKLQG